MDTSCTEWREEWAYLLGMQAYTYGFPAIYYTKLRFGMVQKPQGVINTPLNTFFHVPRLSDHTDQYGGSPMRDAIYSVAWLDLRAEPVIVYVPDSGDRYVSVQFAEFYSDIFGYAGPSVNGGRAQTALVVGPQWQGGTPYGVDVVLRSPTSGAFVVARVSTPGGHDLAAAIDLQNIDQARLKEFPDVPTIVEAGVNVSPLRIWAGFAVHPDTPPAIVQRLQREFAAAAVSAPVVEKLTPFGMKLQSSKSADDFRKQIAAEVVWMTEAAKDLKLEAN